MLRGLYQAATALQTASANQEVTAENLVHATTPGFRRHGMTFEALMAPPTAATARSAGSTRTDSFTSFMPGPMQQTGNPLDLALNGDGFFTLEGPNGPVYTRSGAFLLNPQGELQSASGLRVSGQGGPIRIPQNAGRIEVGVDGAVYADGAEIARLQIAQFDDQRALRRVGVTLFAGPAPRQADPGSVRVEQGYREGSNVEMVQEMISMIMGLRQYEAAERSLRSMGEAIGQNTRPQG